MAKDGAPALYTVEEAAKLLRVGRTKAYAMTQEWRATGGRAGLPVVDFGNVLRVPRAALERVLGVDLSDAPAPAPALSPEATEGRPAPVDEPPAAEPATGPAPALSQTTQRSHRRRGHTVPSDQLDLFAAS